MYSFAIALAFCSLSPGQPGHLAHTGGAQAGGPGTLTETVVGGMDLVVASNGFGAMLPHVVHKALFPLFRSGDPTPMWMLCMTSCALMFLSVLV